MIERKIFHQLKERGISVLLVGKILSRAGIIIPNRTLQYYIDADFLNCTNDRLVISVKKIITNYDNLIKAL